MTNTSVIGFDVHIKRNSDGLVRVYHDESDFYSGGEFQWLDNNYACDCNRHILFQRIAGEEDESDWDIECSNTLYSIVKFVLPNGKEIEVA